MSQTGARGFTLVELLIVVLILAVLAAIVIPQFHHTSMEARESAISSTLRSIRQCIQFYRVQHDDNLPGDDFVIQLTEGTAASGEVGTMYGPYIRNSFPMNPVNLRSDVDIKVIMPEAPHQFRGWTYAKNNGDFRANATGTAPSGTDWYDL